jgi:two-component system, NarL family, response regulator LiaR
LLQSENRFRVLIADAHPICRRGFATFLEGSAHFRLVGEAGSGPELHELIVAAVPDIVVLGMPMPDTDCAATLRSLSRRWPALRRVLLADVADAPSVRLAVAAGASALILRSASPQEVLDALEGVTQGQPMLAPASRIAARPGERATELGADLTLRERELLSLMARGLCNDAISAHLCIAMPTVKFHIANIMSKLRTKNRTAAVVEALRHHIVRVD